MRMLLLVPGLPLHLDQIKGGVHSAVVNLLRGFSTTDVTVRVLSFNREVKVEKMMPYSPGIEIYYVPEGRFSFHSLNYLFSGSSKVLRHIKDFKPDIVHFEEGNSFLFVKSRGLKTSAYVQTIHGMSLEEVKRKKKLSDKITWYFNGYMQKLFSPKNIIHLSDFSRKNYSTLNTTHSTIIPNAIVPAYFHLPLKKQMDNKLLYAGIIDNNKNLLFLLERINDLNLAGKRYTLEVLGGFSHKEIEDKITDTITRYSLQDQVNFHGWVSQTVVIEEVAKADILVVSSMHESLPMVIAECMAAGKVVAASAVGGIPEMIQDTVDGYLFRLDKPDVLNQVLVNLHNNFVKVNQVAVAAKATAFKRYQCDNVAKNTIRFYQECLQIQ